jgi:hypothetical protein
VRHLIRYPCLRSSPGGPLSPLPGQLPNGAGEGSRSFSSPINEKINQSDIPAITTHIFVHKNGPQRWSRPDSSVI